jgi:hypothetical protein
VVRKQHKSGTKAAQKQHRSNTEAPQKQHRSSKAAAQRRQNTLRKAEKEAQLSSISTLGSKVLDDDIPCTFQFKINLIIFVYFILRKSPNTFLNRLVNLIY